LIAEQNKNHKEIIYCNCHMLFVTVYRCPDSLLRREDSRRRRRNRKKSATNSFWRSAIAEIL
jgi:hypothetical protein